MDNAGAIQLERLCHLGQQPRWYKSTQRSEVARVIVRIAKLAVGTFILIATLKDDSLSWSLLWLGGALGYLTHPKPGSEKDEDTIWARVKLLWNAGSIIGLVISYPFFFDKMSFAAVFVVGTIIGGEIYVSRQLHHDSKHWKGNYVNRLVLGS